MLPDDYLAKEIWDGGVDDSYNVVPKGPVDNSLMQRVQKCIPNTVKPWHDGGLKHWDDGDEEKRRDETFKKLIQGLEAQKNTDAVSKAILAPILAALGAKDAEDALQKIKELQWEIDRLTTMVEDAYSRMDAI
jgi:hypothetical protein